MTDEWRVKCEVGCTCGKHQAHPCAPGCKCSRHSAPWKRKKCAEGCTCGRHRTKRCLPGCTCSRHQAAHNRYTDEQRAAALELKRAKDRKYMRQRRLDDPEKFRVERQARKAQGDQRRYFLKYRHGITIQQWTDLHEAQAGCCYLCDGPLIQRYTHLDHDHGCCSGNKSCGSCIRGLACQKCNQGIGQFGDDPDRMRLVANRLELANQRLRNRNLIT